MTFLSRIAWFVVLYSATSPTSQLRAEDPKRELADAVQVRVSELDQQIANSKQTAAGLRQQILDSRRELSGIDRKLQPLLGELEAIDLHRRKSEEAIAQQRDVAAKSRMEHEASAAAAAELRKQLEELQTKLAEIEKKADEAKNAAIKADEKIVQLHQEIAAKADRIGPLTVATKEPTAQRNAAEEQTVALEQQLMQIEEQQRQLQRAIEDDLRAAGQWVSFRDEIAPIVHARCLVCHNARTARGGYSMHSYASLMGEGESGPAIVPGAVDASWLVELVASGDMPVDSHPLSPKEVELFRRWIALGARLDASATAGMSLVQLIPRPEMTSAPVEYPVPPPVTALASSVVDEQRLLATSGYREVLLWSADGVLLRRMDNMLERVYSLAFSPDGRWLAVASGTPGQLGDVSLFDSRSGELLSHLLLADDIALDVVWSPDGSRLAAAAADGKLSVFEVRAVNTANTDVTTTADGSLPEQSNQLTVERMYVVADHADWVNAIAWSDDGRWLATASRDKTAKVFDASTGRGLATFTEHEAEVVDLEFTTDGKQLISADVTGKVLRVWQAENGRQVREVSLDNRSPVVIKRSGPDTMLIAVATGQLLTYSVKEGKLASHIELGDGWPSSLLVDGQGTVWCGDQRGQVQQISLLDGQITNGWACQPTHSP